MRNTVLFDLDGVLVHSEAASLRAASRALAEEGIVVGREDFLPYIGAGETGFIQGPAVKHGKEDRIASMLCAMYEYYREEVRREPIAAEGAAEVVHALKTRGYTTGLVSSSAREKLLQTLDAASIATQEFDLILSGDEVRHRKPNPEPYCTAALRLGKTSKECIVIEDAQNGVRSAKAAGMYCAAVTTSFSAEVLLAAGADRILSNLREILEMEKKG